MEKYINKVNAIQELFKKSEQEQAEKKLQELKEEIMYDVALKNYNSNYQKDCLKYAKLLLKSAKEDKSRPLLHTMYKLDDTYQITDGFIAIVLKEPVAGIEISIGDEQYFDCRNVINRKGKNYYEYDYNYSKVDMDLFELEQLALKSKKYKNPPYPTELLSYKYNTYYHPLRLLTAIKILGTKDVKVYFNTSNEKDPIYLKSNSGEAVVLPIIVNQELK